MWETVLSVERLVVLLLTRILGILSDSSFSVGIDGKPKWNSGIDWSGTPEELGFSNPYAVAILPRHVEFRNVETKALVQSAEMPHARFLAQGKGKLLYVASTTEVWRLIPNSFQQQV